MRPTTTTTTSAAPAAFKRKAPPLPSTHRTHKRPLLRPPVQPPQQCTIYISTRTPFISAVKRAQGHLDAKGSTEVVLRASGRAIDMALQVALYFKESYGVRVRTGEVSVVDDVVRVGEEGMVAQEGMGGEGEGDMGMGMGMEEMVGGKGQEGQGEKKEGQRGEAGNTEDTEDIEARERRVSTVEVVISVLDR